MNSFISEANTNLSSTTSYFNNFIAQVFGWMTFGILTTAVTSVTVLFLSAQSVLLGNLFYVSLPFVLILELAVVLVLSFFWRKFNGFIALGLFIFYAILNGVFFGILMQVYTLQSIAIAFGATFLTFGVMAAYGYFTKSDLTRFRSLTIMGLVGVLVGTFINIIITLINPTLGEGLYWILTYVGLGVFIILVAADTQKLKQLSYEAENQGKSILNYSIQGALILYLDFINIFIRILAITGKKR